MNSSFGGGRKLYLETINQLFEYLTWRDTNAIVVVLVKNRNIESVSHIIERETCSHPNFVRYKGKDDGSLLNYHFHLTGDRIRRINLKILIFHLP